MIFPRLGSFWVCSVSGRNQGPQSWPRRELQANHTVPRQARVAKQYTVCLAMHLPGWRSVANVDFITPP